MADEIGAHPIIIDTEGLGHKLIECIIESFFIVGLTGYKRAVKCGAEAIGLLLGQRHIGPESEFVAK